jgi:hypothetical protein
LTYDRAFGPVNLYLSIERRIEEGEGERAASIEATPAEMERGVEYSGTRIGSERHSSSGICSRISEKRPGCARAVSAARRAKLPLATVLAALPWALDRTDDLRSLKGKLTLRT